MWKYFSVVVRCLCPIRYITMYGSDGYLSIILMQKACLRSYSLIFLIDGSLILFASVFFIR